MRPSFTSPTLVWDVNEFLGDLSQDPDNSNHLVFAAGPIGALCKMGADIYYYDASLPDPHQRASIVSTSVANGGRTVIFDDPAAPQTGLMLLGTDRAWLAWRGMTATQMLPP